MTLNNKLTSARELTDASLENWLKLPVTKDKRVIEAMRYSAIGGGKAFRPFLILTISDILGVPQKNALTVATALEMVHTYSLIHDDLPAMDNDSLRRGKPTSHIQFDEATAILAGDGLLTKAFEVLSDEQVCDDCGVRIKLINALAKCAGCAGMVGGQMIDLIGEKETLTLDEIKQMQLMKTGALLKFACIAPAIMANAEEKVFKSLETYAHNIGIMFQITDDILDATGDSKLVGKTLKKDANAHKSTFVSLLGIQKAKEYAEELGAQAKEAIQLFGDKAFILSETVDFILTRDK